MKFRVEKSSDWEYGQIREFDSLQSLLEWVLGLERPCVVLKCEPDGTWVMEIYDTWRE